MQFTRTANGPIDPAHESHIRGRFATVAVDSRPFPHMVIDQVLPPDMYAEIEALLPARQQWDAATRLGAPTIGVCHAAGQTTPGLEPQAEALARYAPVVDLLNELTVQALAPWIDRTATLLLAEEIFLSPPSGQSGPALFCHRPNGWEIQPHAHNVVEAVQSMIYFPLPGSGDALGTDFFRPTFDRSFSKEELLRSTVFESWEIARSKAIAYRPNRLIAWHNSPCAVHGTRTIPGAPPRQYLFMAVHYRGDVDPHPQGRVRLARFSEHPPALPEIPLLRAASLRLRKFKRDWTRRAGRIVGRRSG
jgi:hypothetical protein